MGSKAMTLLVYLNGFPSSNPNSHHQDLLSCYYRQKWMQKLTISILPQLFLSDPGTKFAQSIGWTMGERTARFAMIVDHGKIVYAEKEPGRDVTVSRRCLTG